MLSQNADKRVCLKPQTRLRGCVDLLYCCKTIPSECAVRSTVIPQSKRRLRDCSDSSCKQGEDAGRLGMQRSQQQFPQHTKEAVRLHFSSP